MSHPHDSQRSRVYRAESSAFDAINPSYSDRFPGNGKLLDATVAILQSPFWISATDNKLPRSARLYSGSTCVPWVVRGAQLPGDKLVALPVPRQLGYMGLCHSLAHLLAPATETHPYHGPEFCQAYLIMLKHYFPKPHDLLIAEFAREKVKTVVVSPEDIMRKKVKAEERKRKTYERKESTLQDNLMKLARRYD